MHRQTDGRTDGRSVTTMDNSVSQAGQKVIGIKKYILFVINKYMLRGWAAKH